MNDNDLTPDERRIILALLINVSANYTSIANATGIRRLHVARTMNDLERRGLLEASGDVGIVRKVH